MKRRPFFTFVHLSVAVLALVTSPTAFGADLRVNESATRISLAGPQPQILLALENPSGRGLPCQIDLELLDPIDGVRARASLQQDIRPQASVVSVPVAFVPSESSDEDRKQIPWYRLHYRIRSNSPGHGGLVEGIVALSEITNDLFQLTVTAPRGFRKGTRYRAWVRALHPVSLLPVAGVRADGEIEITDGNRLRSTGVTDSEGYAPLAFNLPRDLQNAEWKLKVTAFRGGYIQKADIEIEPDRTAEILLTSDKPIYQPGQTLHLRALVFDSSKQAIADSDAVFSIVDSEYAKVLTAPVKTSRFGVATLDWSMPENLRLGNYVIEFELVGDEFEDSQAHHSISVSRYELPNFSVVVQTDRKYYLPGQKAEVEVRAEFLFGQPVTRGHVRIVRETEREWNYREQKWESAEGESHEGKVGADGRFLVYLDLSAEHEELWKGEPFRDLTYAAYFTDATTGRTEQRRFDLRVTKEPVHVYVIDPVQTMGLPLLFYVKTLYADGSPAQCEVTINKTLENSEEPFQKVMTNSFGLARITGAILDMGWSRQSGLSLALVATDSLGATGTGEHKLWYSDFRPIRLATDKTVYRPGESIQLDITTAQRDLSVVIYVFTRAGLVDSQVVRLSSGVASVLLPYTGHFENEVTISAVAQQQQRRYGWHGATRTVLFPSRAGLKVDVKLTQSVYKPGAEVLADLFVSSADRSPVEAVLGAVVLDKAVEHRDRTDRDFGSQTSFRWFWLSEEDVAGIKLADLYELDLSKTLPDGLDLVAELLLLNDTRLTGSSDSLAVEEGELIEKDPKRVFTPLIERQLRPREIAAALAAYSKRQNTFPRNGSELARALRRSGIELQNLRDPWRRPYYAEFRAESRRFDLAALENYSRFPGPSELRNVSVTRDIGHVILRSMGPNGEGGEVDDFEVARFSGVISAKEISQESNRLRQITKAKRPALVGALRGKTADSSGAVIPGVEVKATLKLTSMTYQTRSDAQGHYVLTNLPPGSYEVRFNLSGFRTSIVDSVPVYRSTQTTVDTVLEIGTVTETVEVSAGNMDIRVNAAMVAGSGTGGTTPRLRQYFTETLLWQPSIETDSQGKAQIRFKLADNITTWKLAVIGSTVDGKIATAETEFRAFQPFFIEHQPPPVLTEGDEIALPVVVRNYLENSQEVKLELQPENWFSLLGPARKQLLVAAGAAMHETFDLRAVQSIPAGVQRITATSAQAGDAVEKKVTVHFDGEELAQTVSEALSESTTLDTKVPDRAIPGSLRSELKIYPDILAHALEGIEGILQRPYGCAEQTISSTYPNVMVLRYFERNIEDLPPAAGKALHYTQKGYERLLGYRSGSGGFSYWGRGEADIALTAYALRFLHDVALFVRVDEKVVQQARDWLIGQQSNDGSWQPSHWAPNENDHRRALFTASVARTLASLDLGARPRRNSITKTRTRETGDSLTKALAYLSHHATKIVDPYLVACHALAALNLGQKEHALAAIEKLSSMAREERDGTYWDQKSTTPFHGWGLAGRLETTALAIQALIRGRERGLTDNDSLIRRGLLFLIRNKDRYGVWHSTRASVTVLEALVAADRVLPVPQGREKQIEISVNNHFSTTLQIPTGNRPLTLDLSQRLNRGDNRVAIRSTATGPLTNAQLVTTYYVPWSVSAGEERKDNALRLDVSFSDTRVKMGEEVTCKVRAERLESRSYGMMLAEVGLPPGAEVDRSSLEHAMNDWGRYDVLPDRLVFYLWPRERGINFEFTFRPRIKLKAKTAPSQIYDYYNPDARVVVAPAVFLVQ